MDLISGLFGAEASVFLLRSQMRGPFAIEITDRAPLTFVTLARRAVDVVVGGTAHHLDLGGIALVRGTTTWRLADARDSPPVAVIEPGQVCRGVGGSKLATAWDRGLRTWGNAGPRSASHLLLSGTYERLPATAAMLLDQLPDVFVVTGRQASAALRSAIDLLAREIVEDHLAQQVVLSRLADLTVALALRHWIDHAAALPPCPVRGYADHLVGPAIRELLADPSKPWTIARLARTVGMSRAALARRFAEITGTTPIAFLTRWRLALAAERLTTTDDQIASIATEVGYGSAFALTTAFKRQYGVSPTRYRAAGREGSRSAGGTRPG